MINKRILIDSILPFQVLMFLLMFLHGTDFTELILPLILRGSYDSFQIDMEKVRAHVIVEGRVQGVFFRYHTQEMAFKLDVKGWVKNRWDGSVEAAFEGDKERVNQIIQWCHRGPSEARVTKVHLDWEDYTGEFKDFSINY
jgi:acylphosphatase